MKPSPDERAMRPLKPLPNLIFASRWLQLPLYLGLIIAQGIYVWLLNPVNSEPHGPVRLVTASFPSVLIPMIVYAAIVRLWLVPAGVGGYRASTAPLPLRKPNI